jgi:hypothetical protein
MRNVGGSVGTALLDTVITRREQFHDFRIGDSVNQFSLAVQDRLNLLTQQIQATGFDPVDASNKSLWRDVSVVTISLWAGVRSSATRRTPAFHPKATFCLASAQICRVVFLAPQAIAR